jgi:hypothetical protein
MANESQYYTPEDFVDRLSRDEIFRPIILTGLVKASDDDATSLFFARGKCEDWVRIPVSAIEHIEVLDIVACKDHTHPMVKLVLKRPKTEEAIVFLSLARLVNSRSLLHPPLSAVRHRVVRRGDGNPGTGRAMTRADPGCNDYDIDDAGVIWCFVESSEHYCIYVQC